MPYSSVADFKKSQSYKRLKSHYGGNVSASVVRQFMQVVNSSLDKGLPESRAIRSAWAAVRHNKGN